MAIVKKKRVSKKSKLSWRKHVNITDVEEFLDDLRLEERLGPPLETLPNDELFEVDNRPAKEFSTKTKRRLALITKPPRCFAVLEPHTKVPDPIKKRNHVKTKEERKNQILKKKEEDNFVNGVLRYKELQVLSDRQVDESRRQLKYKRGDFNINIWDEGTNKPRKTLETRNKSKTTLLPSIDLPHPGMSYNPSYVDHQELLRTVTEKEVNIIKKEEHLNRVTTCMFNKVSASKRDATWLEEMCQGLPDTKGADDSDSGGEYKALNPATKNKKKTTKQLRKQKVHVQMEHLRKLTKLNRKKNSDLHHLKALNKQIQKNENKAEIVKAKRMKAQLLKKTIPKRLSATKFEETDLEFNMGPDIAGNLRNLKKEGNLLTDRFKSLQKRNIIEPATRRHRKKSKVKVYTKPGHKEDWLKTVAREDAKI